MTTTALVPPPERPWDRLRGQAEASLLRVGELTSLAVQTIQQMRRAPIERPLLLAQLDQIGVRSISIVVITSAFIGMVLALQTAYALEDFGGKLCVGTIGWLARGRRRARGGVGPVGGGRAGAGMTAELGTMKVTEQIDALRALATNPVRKLVVPRVLATTIMFPLLTVVSILLGIAGGGLIAVANLNLSANYYFRSVVETVKYNDLASGIGKTFFFGFAIALIACYNGLRTSGGADGVGRSTTMTVVTGAITVLIMDFFLTKLFLLLF